MKTKTNKAHAVEPHNFTYDGNEVLILRRCNKDRTSRDGFRYPEGVGAAVEAPDWNDAAECGGGLHGWPWGFGLGDGAEYDLDDLWLVIGALPADVVGNLGGGWKCKFRRGVIRFEGGFANALAMLRDGFRACIEGMAASGDYSQLAASGDYSQLAASGDYSQLAASGDFSCVAVAASGGQAKAGEGGAFALAYFTDGKGWNFAVGVVGENGIKANTWYCVQGGKLAEVAQRLSRTATTHRAYFQIATRGA